jgi:nitroreductase
MDVTEAIRTRRSVGRSDGDPGDEAIHTLIELATWAPNHHLTEPWRFTVLRGPARARLGALWAARAADAAGIAGEARVEFERRQLEKLLRAPVLIVVSTRTDDDPVVADEDFAATCAAVQNMLLGAAGLGLGAIWRTGGMIRDPGVKAFLNLDPADKIVAVVYLGARSTVAPAARSRDIDGVIHWMAECALALRDEGRAYARMRERVATQGAASGSSTFGAFGTSFAGVALEGLEVAFIVLALGRSPATLQAAGLGAAAAAGAVIGVGIILHRPLRNVPENALKLLVGIMLCGIGTFWFLEGTGLQWPSDVAVLIPIAFYGVAAWVCVAAIARRARPA